jgi:hypothetical protein
VSISLVRPHTEHIRPPRALWVPFALGRPFAVPDDPEFQTEVLTAALRLFERTSGPVLEDFPTDAPEQPVEDEPTIQACPIPRRTADAAPPGARDLLAAEIAFLRPWYDQAVRDRQRTTVGVSGLTPESAAELLADWLESDDDTAVPAERLKLALDDLRAYCLEAGAAQPGAGTSAAVLEHWYWWETQVGAALRGAHPRATESSDPALRMVGKVLMIPVAQRAGAG